MSSQVKITSDVAYAVTKAPGDSSVTNVSSDHHSQEDVIKSLDIYQPPESIAKPPNGYPVIFYIHGGAFIAGHKKYSINPCKALAEQGYVTIATSYSQTSFSDNHYQLVLVLQTILLLLIALTARTLNQMLLVMVVLLVLDMFFILIWICLPRNTIHHPDHIMDVAKSFKWSYDNISAYDGNPNMMFLAGHSAGGLLASLLATNHAYLDAVEVDGSEYIKGVISISGVYSDVRLSQTTLGKELLVTVFGDRPQYYDAFPIYNINHKTPPFLLLSAGLDISLKPHTLDFHYALKQAGVYVKTVYFDDLSHWNICYGWNIGMKNERILLAVKEFIKQVEEYHNEKVGGKLT